ncbi:hypothetical protein CERSUDRAFT_117530 [Gelatoporia subvermispora B]|uniref:Uncharacterized protein n=1 Tax=Ceriporiopsis subvermispora (strain B) TaxID=914234 RepID=M2PDV4_CERS8|nr:hypothetical protein CERSUDRAFT_117530 [Gelatoporia subvermispora B]
MPSRDKSAVRYRSRHDSRLGAPSLGTGWRRFYGCRPCFLDGEDGGGLHAIDGLTTHVRDRPSTMLPQLQRGASSGLLKGGDTGIARKDVGARTPRQR